MRSLLQFAVAVLVIALGACSRSAPPPAAQGPASTQPAAPLKVRFSSRLGLRENDLAKLDELLDRPVQSRAPGRAAPLRLVLAGNRASPRSAVSTATTAREYLALRRDGYRPRPGADLAIEAWFKEAALPLCILSTIRPAKISHVATLDLSTDALTTLPPALAPVFSAAEAEQVRQLAVDGKTWKEIWPEAVVEKAGSDHVIIRQRAGLTDIVLLAWGDFDGDGIEDVLLSAINCAAAGNYRESRYVVVTRLEPGDRLRPVFEMQ